MAVHSLIGIVLAVLFCVALLAETLKRVLPARSGLYVDRFANGGLLMVIVSAIALPIGFIVHRVMDLFRSPVGVDNEGMQDTILITLGLFAIPTLLGLVTGLFKPNWSAPKEIEGPRNADV